MRSLAVEAATVPCGFWPGAQKKCFGFVRSVVRDDAVDAPSVTARITSTTSTPARRARVRTLFMFPPVVSESILLAINDRIGSITNLDPKTGSLAGNAALEPDLGSTSVWDVGTNPPNGGLTLGRCEGSIGPPNDSAALGEWPHPCRRDSHFADITSHPPVASRHLCAGGLSRLADRESRRHERPAGPRSRPDAGPVSGDRGQPRAAPAHAGGCPEASPQQASGVRARSARRRVR